MSANNPYDPLAHGAPPEPHTEAFNTRTTSPPLPDSPGRASEYDLADHSMRAVPPNLDVMPVPDSYLNPARPPQRFYGALANEPGVRTSFASSSPSMDTLPRPGFGYRDSDYDSVTGLAPPGSPAGESRLSSWGYQDDGSQSHPMVDLQSPYDDDNNDKRAYYAAPDTKKRRSIKFVLIGAAVLLIIAIAVIVPLYFFVLRKDTKNGANDGPSKGGDDGGKSSSAGGTTSPPTSNIAITGGDKSKVTTEDGTTFTYSNQFGGYWFYDQNDPFNNSARAQSWSPALNESWRYGIDTIRGVNIGGWLVTEPFISPALYEPYANGSTPAIDEWSLSLNMAADTANGGLNQLENHYKTFITESDFAQIAGAGLNWVRIAFPFWAINKYDDEPFLEGVAWNYFLKAIAWARKYGIRINLDLHAVPGSQNAFNHSGKMGAINWLSGVMGIANAQRSMDYIRIIAEFISQPQYSDVVVMFGLVNEPVVDTIGQDVVGDFYLQVHDMIRNITGYGEGKGPMLSMHDGFIAIPQWAGFLAGSDRITLDTHPYLAFGTQDPSPPASQASIPCARWGNPINDSMSAFGFTIAGEWSLGWTDCSLWLNGVGLGTRFEGTYAGYIGKGVGDCAPLLDWPNYNQATKDGLKAFALAQMDALQNYFFWTWKIGNSTVTGKVESPHWSYQLGLQQGWIPADPRTSVGTCAKQGTKHIWQAPLESWQTGGAGAGTISANQRSSYSAWPPTTLKKGTLNGAALPTYTPTGSIQTLAVPTLTKLDSSQTISAGNGWFAPSDSRGVYTPVAGCTYPDQWNATSVAIPAACTGSTSRRRDSGGVDRIRIREPVITAAPRP